MSCFAISGFVVVKEATATEATYHAGAALDLATLKALQDTLISEIAAI